MLTQDEVKKLFYYKDGFLYRVKTNRRVDTVGYDGYINITVNKRTVKAHRLIYLLHHGYVKHFVKHIDGNMENNHIENLVSYSKEEYIVHKKARYKNQIKNIYFKNKKYEVVFTGKDKYYFRKVFDKLEDAKLYKEECLQKILKGDF